MSDYQVKSPVLFLIFNRPDTTQMVFEQIKKAKPEKLYIAADGPREDRPNEIILCKETRSIVQQINWNCNVQTLFREENLGCKIAISSAIDWFFENEEEGIILEDDCLPSNGFFDYCAALLEYYRYDTRITHIGGSNLQLGQKRGDASYYFSNLTHVWGWAGWKRVWNTYDVDLKSFPLFRDQEMIKNCPSHFPFADGWLNALEKTHNGEIDTWDYQYSYANLINNGLSIIPNVNLISNIGFGLAATHTFDENHFFASLKTEEITEIVHPLFVLPDIDADIFTQEKENYVPPAKKKGKLSRLWKSFKTLLKKRVS